MRIPISIAVAVALSIGECALAFADGGQIRAMESHGDHQFTVFTSPIPLRAGPIDVSVLLQHVHTGQTIADTDVTVELTRPNKSHPPIRSLATTAAATNKLLRAAIIDLPAPGQWSIRVECTTPQASTPIIVTFDVDVAPPLPPWLTVWLWFTWPVAVVALFAVHRTLVARRKTGGTPGASSDGRGEFATAEPRPSPRLRDVPHFSHRTNHA